MRSRTTVLLSLLIFLAVTGESRGQIDAGCTESGCHDSMAEKEYVHGPVGVGACNICHTAVEGKDHEFQFSVEKEQLCFSCHEESRDMMLQEHLHTPVAEGGCTGCHDPHQSDYRFNLKGQAADLCFQCHDRIGFEGETVHGPVAGGDCNVCHNPHASANPHQLERASTDLCLGCHVEKTETMQMRHVHDPVETACTECHNPHAAPESMLLPATSPDLCFQCHDRSGFEQTMAHQPVASGRCSDCHLTHASNHPRMFVLPAEELCFSCHQDINDQVSASAYKHGPVQEGDCNACHSPHGSEHYRMLIHDFPEEFYMPYQTSHYALCFECHSGNIALEAETSTLTDFRDGKVNLHYLHVNKDPKGRSCKSCHEPHATGQAKHIRTSVPYGSMNWDLPVDYTELDDGGSCVVGCHAPKEYHRK
jgi:predicted CXXCH cytochrome family protein